MNLTVVIPTRNRPRQVRHRVEEFKGWNCEVVVVDDFSQQPLVADGAMVIRNHQRLGYGESCNVGCKQAKRDWLLLIADDIVPSPGMASFVDEIIPKLEAQDVIGFRIVGSNTMGSNTVSLYRDTVFSRMLDILFGIDISRQSGPSRFVSGAMIFSSEFFTLLGGFDSRTYGGNGFREESDLQWRARKMGGRLMYIEDPFFQHLNVPGGYQKVRSENEFYYMRNQTIFALRTSPIASPVLIAGFGAWLLARGLPIPILVRGVARGLAVVVSGITRETRDLSKTR